MLISKQIKLTIHILDNFTVFMIYWDLPICSKVLAFLLLFQRYAHSQSDYVEPVTQSDWFQLLKAVLIYGGG